MPFLIKKGFVVSIIVCTGDNNYTLQNSVGVSVGQFVDLRVALDRVSHFLVLMEGSTHGTTFALRQVFLQYSATPFLECVTWL